MACFSDFLDNYFTAREYGWTESSDSEVSAELFVDEVKSDLQSSEGEEIPFAWHGPVLKADLEEINMQRNF